MTKPLETARVIQALGSMGYNALDKGGNFTALIHHADDPYPVILDTSHVLIPAILLEALLEKCGVDPTAFYQHYESIV